MDKLQKRVESDKVLLRNDLSPNQKLFIISQIYKEELNNQFPQLHYVLLEWKDSHLKELRSKQVIDCLASLSES